MAVIPYTKADVKLLARLKRAEGEDKSGMLMVGNTGVNRVYVNCIDLTDINTVRVYQSPGGLRLHRKDIFTNMQVNDSPTRSDYPSFY